MPQVPLTQGKFAIVDHEDLVRLSSFTWRAKNCRGAWYAVTGGGPGHKLMFMHVFLSGPNRDHKNRNTLDNRKTNLRPATHVENMRNRGKFNGCGSKYKGVTRHYSGKWQAQIGIGAGKVKYLGLFLKEKAAALRYDEYARSIFGAFAKLNFSH